MYWIEQSSISRAAGPDLLRDGIGGAFEADDDAGLDPTPRDERFEPGEVVSVRREAVPPELAVEPGEASDPVCGFVDRERSSGVARIAAAADDVFHHEQEVEAGFVDQRQVHGGVFDREVDVGAEHPRLVEEATGCGVELGVVRIGGLEEDGLRTGALAVGEREPGAAVGAVIAERWLDAVHLDPGCEAASAAVIQSLVTSSQLVGMVKSVTWCSSSGAGVGSGRQSRVGVGHWVAAYEASRRSGRAAAARGWPCVRAAGCGPAAGPRQEG